MRSLLDLQSVNQLVQESRDSVVEINRATGRSKPSGDLLAAANDQVRAIGSEKFVEHELEATLRLIDGLCGDVQRMPRRQLSRFSGATTRASVRRPDQCLDEGQQLRERGRRFDVHPSHEPPAMHLDRLLRNVELAGDLFVKFAPREQREYLSCARGEGREKITYVLTFSLLDPRQRLSPASQRGTKVPFRSLVWALILPQ